jgi:hypothetical protein
VSRLQDNQNAVAFTYGPLVLSAGLGTDSMTTTSHGVQVLKATKPSGLQDSIAINSGTTINAWLSNIQSNLVQTPGKLECKLKNTDSDSKLVFIPHYSRYQDRYGIYWMLAFASTCCPEGIGYAMSTSPTGPWQYKNSIMDPNSQANGNHPGIIEFKGSSYVLGFNWRLQEKRTGARNREMRSVSVEKFTYNADGTIPKLPFWSETVPEQVGTLNPYVQTEAETIAWAWDVRTETCSEGGTDVTSIENGDYIKVRGSTLAPALPP